MTLRPSAPAPHGGERRIAGRTAGPVAGFLGLAGLLVVAGVLTLLALDMRAQGRRDAIRDVEASASLLADHASRLFEVADVALRGAAGLSTGLDWDAAARSAELQRELKTMASTLPYVEDVWLNDATGALRSTSFAFPAPASNAADRDAFKAQVRPTDRMYVDGRIIGRVTGTPTFLLARRLQDGTGAFRGMASVTADLSYFTDFWGKVRLPPRAEVTLFRAQTFDVLARHPDAGPGDAPDPTGALRAAIGASREAGLVDPAAAGGAGDRIIAYRRVGDLPVYLAVGVPEAAVAAAWRGRLAGYAPLALAAMLGLAGLSAFGFRQAGRDALATAALKRAQVDLSEANARLERTVEARTAEARASEGRLRLILESATEFAIIATDLAGTVTHWSTGARNVFGWEPADAVGRSARLIFTPEDQAAGVLEAELGKALTEGRAADDRWQTRRDGSRFFATGALVPMRGPDGAPTGFLKILRDRTREHEADEARRSLNATLERLVAERTRGLEAANERLVAEAASRQQAEEQLRQAQKMEAVGRLTGGIAHDFNNLLTIISGSLDMARRRLGRGDAVRAETLLGQAAEGADRAAALTYRLLAFSRQHPLAPEPVDANRLVGGMSDLLGRTLGETVAIETVLAGGLWRTHADPNQLESALLNLAVNARDAMPDGGQLTIETANTHLDESYAASREEVAAGQYVMVAVSDTGTGMAPEVVARIFEPFFTTKPVGKGTGLGLSQVYGFAKQSGGHVAVYSEAGHGTTIKLYLPRFRQVGEAAAVDRVVEVRREPVAPLVPATAAETVLVVEDEPMVRAFSVAALEEAGYRVLSAGDGPSGLAILDAHPEVRVLFTDVVLTGPMNGRKVADEALRRRPDLKLLFTTGYTRNAIIHHGRLDEGVKLISKPFTSASLAAKLRAVLDDADGA